MTISPSCADGLRRFDFGRCELSHDKPRDAVPYGRSVILAVCGGAVLVDSGKDVSRLEARSSALFTGGHKLDIALTEHVGAAILWCTARGDDPASRSVAGSFRLGDDQPVLSDQIDALMRLGIQVETEGTGFEQGLRDALGMAIFSTFRVQAASFAHGLLPNSVRKARNYIDQNCQEAVDLAGLATIAGVTREHLNVVFRKHVGLTPMRYLWNVRTQKAVGLVRGTDMTLASVADLCGFKSPFHLSREIKRSTGLSPRDLRRSGPMGEAHSLPPLG